MHAEEFRMQSHGRHAIVIKILRNLGGKKKHFLELMHIRQHVKPHMIGQRQQSDRYGILYLKASLLEVFSSPNPVCLSAFSCYGYKNLARQSS